MTLDEAKAQAKNHHCFIVAKSNCYFLYRRTVIKNYCIGKRKNVQEIIELTKRICA